MAIDVRAKVQCSLGVVISGTISDDPLQGTGLIRTTGSLVIKDIIKPSAGTAVTITYVGAAGGGSIPRSLLVLSSFADPFKRITTVEVGCKLAYMQDKRERIDWTAFDDPATTMTPADAAVVTVPITAQAVADKCIAKLGLTGSVTLTNKFSIEKFDFSPGYFTVLSNLLASECQCGFVNASGNLEVFSLNATGGSGPLINAGSIIDVNRIGSGQLPGGAVVVSYTTRKLRDVTNDQDATEKRNWESSETIDLPATVYVSNPFYDVNPFPYSVPQFFEYNYVPRTVTTSKYDSWDRLLERRTINYTILADVAPGYIAHRAGTGGIPGQSTPTAGSIPYTLEQLTTFEYEITAPADGATAPKPDGYEKILKETTISYEPYIKLAASTPIYQFAGASNIHFDWKLGSYNKFISQKTETTYDISYDSEGAQISKTLTSTASCYGYTQRGQQYVSYSFSNAVLWDYVDGVGYSNGRAEEILEELSRLIPQGTREEITTGRELNLQRRPGGGTNSFSNGGNPVESKSELELVSGSSESQRRVEFTMPYAPDDTFIKNQDGTYTGVPSDAPQKAQLFGQVQNRILLGNRNGMSIQVSAKLLPSAPFGAFVVSSGGVGGVYRANGTTWSFDANGIVGSTDGLFWGGAGG